jgi:hypothetical protein
VGWYVLQGKSPAFLVELVVSTAPDALGNDWSRAAAQLYWRENASHLRWNRAAPQTYVACLSVRLVQSVPMFNTIYNQRNDDAAFFIGRNPRQMHLPNKFDLNHKFSAPKIGLTFEKTDHIL